MHFAGRTTAVLLLASLACQWHPAPLEAAGSGTYACYGAKAYGRRCGASHPRGGGQALHQGDALARRRSGISGSPRLRRKLYAGTEATILQLSPKLRARNISRLRFDPIERDTCFRKGPRNGCAEESNLADALIRPPSAFTAKILRENGIPLIPDVPPIVILRSTGEWAP